MNRMTPVTDPVKIAAIVGAGKYREHLAFWAFASETLWVMTARAKGSSH